MCNENQPVLTLNIGYAVRIAISVCMLVISACATVGTTALPPVLTQEEVMRPYQKVGVLELTRERFGSTEDISAGDYEWAYLSLREQAAKMGADAVIFPEISTTINSYFLFPSSNMRVKGVAIKFR